MSQPRVVLDEDDIRRTLVRIAHEIVEKHAGRPVALVLTAAGAVLLAPFVKAVRTTWERNRRAIIGVGALALS